MARLTQLSRSIAGQVAVVTGAASGMGRSTAYLLADEGASVAVLDRSREGAEAVAQAIVANGGQAVAVVVDLAEGPAIEAAVEEARVALGPIDLLVNNAGISIPAPIDHDDFDEAWGQTMAVNLTAYAGMIRASLADLCRHGAGRVVNVASTEGLGATAFIAPYTSAKHGVVGLTRSLSVELGPRGGHGELCVPRADSHRHDRGDPRCRQGQVRSAAGADAALRRPRGSGPDHPVALAAGGLVHHGGGDRGGWWPHRAKHMKRERGRS